MAFLRISGRGDPAARFADYHPAWVDKMAERRDPRGVDPWTGPCGARTPSAPSSAGPASCTTVRTSISSVRGATTPSSRSPRQVRGTPVGAIHLITFNADGEAQHIVVNYRPISSLMFFSRLLREKFAGTPYAEYYLAGGV